MPNRIKIAQDPIAIVAKAIEKTWPEIIADVVYMNDDFFEKNGVLEWATAERDNGKSIIFVNPHRTLFQIIISIAKGAVSLKMELADTNFDEESEEFKDLYLQVSTKYAELIGVKK